MAKCFLLELGHTDCKMLSNIFLVLFNVLLYITVQRLWDDEWDNETYLNVFCGIGPQIVTQQNEMKSLLNVSCWMLTQTDNTWYKESF